MLLDDPSHGKTSLESEPARHFGGVQGAWSNGGWEIEVGIGNGGWCRRARRVGPFSRWLETLIDTRC